MDFDWSPAQQALHARMRALGAEVAALPEEARLDRLAAEGVLGLCIDRAWGGGGASFLDAVHAYEGLGHALPDGGLLLAAGAHLFGVAATVMKVGSEAQRAHLLPTLAGGEVLATIAATEAEAGSDVGAVATTVTPAGEGYRVRGEKAWVTMADRAGCFLVVGRRPGDRGLTVALLPRSPAVLVGAPIDTLGLRGARLAPVRFEDAEGQELLGKPGAGMAVFQRAMVHERALVLAFRLGALERLLDETVTFCRQRRVGGTPIARQASVAQRVAQMKLGLETARLLVYRAAWRLDRDERGGLDAALAKWHLAQVAVDNSLAALGLRGGAGYRAEAGFGALLDDALGGTIHSGTPEILSGIVARLTGL
ncbi:MAG: acyl-CoA dehydrogenase family protein [Polyangiaceae bacterium]